MNPSSLVERWQLVQAINADPELSASAVKVAVALMGFVNSTTGACYPNFERIMAACHVSKATVVRATHALESQGWVRIERDMGGDRESNRYHFAFERIRKDRTRAVAVPEAFAVTDAAEIHGIKIKPCSDILGVKSEPGMVSKFSDHGLKTTPKLEEDNSFKGTQESLFRQKELPKVKPFDFEVWFEQEWWPQYPPARRVEKAEAKKMAKATIEGSRSDGLKATPDELLAGIMRYAASPDVRRGYCLKPTNWLKRGCWADEHLDRAGRHVSASADAVWSAIDSMATRNRSVG